MIPSRKGDGTGLSVPGVSEVRKGDGTVLWSAGAAIPDSALYYWPVDGGSGQTIVDDAGSADISLIGGTWEADVDAVGDFKISLDGSNDRGDAQVPIANESEILVCATIETTDTGGKRIVSWDETNSFGIIYAEILSGGNIRWSVGNGSDIVNADASSNIADGTKQRVALRITENTEIGVGVNGTVEATTGFGTKGAVSDAFGLGYSRLNGDSNLNSTFDDLVIYPDASDQQISDDYNLQPWS